MSVKSSYASDEIVEIPLRNKKRDIAGHAIISKSDEENVAKHKWYLVKSGKNKNNTYVQTSINRVPIRLHQFILGKKSDKGIVIDHINGDGLCNIRENLRFASFSLNNQNKAKRKGTSSKYIGVSQTRTSAKYSVCHKGVTYGQYSDEKEAAKIYDSVVLILSNGNGKTNNLVTYEDVKDKTINDIVLVKRIPPSHIMKRGKSYYVKISYKRHLYTKYRIKTLHEAKQCLQNFKSEIALLQETEKQRILSLPIERNKDNIAVIYAYNKNKEIVGESLVDDDKWHELFQKKWCMSEGYFKDGKNTSMHRFLMSASKNDDLVDHINHNPLDNRLSNLRFSTHSGNAHNRTKIENATSKYYGVYWHNTLQYWVSEFNKDHIRYIVGYFTDEEEAAAAYNVKARELYSEFANLNTLQNELELLEITERKRLCSSKYRGVNWSKEKEKWKARLNYRTTAYNIGYYETEIEAACAYNIKVREICPNETKRINIVENEDDIIKLTVNRTNNQSSKYRGVSYNKEKMKYEAYITYKNKTHKLGYFDKDIDAAKAYNDKACEIHGKCYKHFNIISPSLPLLADVTDNLLK